MHKQTRVDEAIMVISSVNVFTHFLRVWWFIFELTNASLSGTVPLAMIRTPEYIGLKMLAVILEVNTFYYTFQFE